MAGEILYPEDLRLDPGKRLNELFQAHLQGRKPMPLPPHPFIPVIIPERFSVSTGLFIDDEPVAVVEMVLDDAQVQTLFNKLNGQQVTLLLLTVRRETR